ncbi:MAG: DUF2270 domain-containing protein [Gemmatimonadetes bacterium]|nr:DUF2270 domain-containing protein [Gemmatimonadota bacterium]
MSDDETTAPDPDPSPDEEGTPPQKPFEAYPLTREEYIGVITHFYRGELGRAEDWRARLDPTTNWAVVTAGGMLSIAFTSPYRESHVTILLAMILVTVFLGFEARRFRYFDVWRSRVRMIEENFLIPVIRRNLVSPRSDWRDFVALDLDQPTFKITIPQAIGIRLRFNYLWIYYALLLAWIAKLQVHPEGVDTTPARLLRRMQVGPFDGTIVLAAVTLFYVAISILALRGRGRDEIQGVEGKMWQWKR